MAVGTNNTPTIWSILGQLNNIGPIEFDIAGNLNAISFGTLILPKHNLYREQENEAKTLFGIKLNKMNENKFNLNWNF